MGLYEGKKRTNLCVQGTSFVICKLLIENFLPNLEFVKNSTQTKLDKTGTNYPVIPYTIVP